LVENVIDAGNLEAIFVADSQGQLVTASSPTRGKDLEAEYYQGLDVIALETIKTLKPAVQFRGNSAEASVPLAGFGSKPGALICKLDTHELKEATASALRDVLILSVAGLFAGALVSSVLAKRVSGPIRKLVEAASVIGAGGFRHRVPVESGDEVGRLAESFNQMADSLDTYTAKLARTTAEKEVMARELDIAAEIQKSLLPDRCPPIPNLDLAAASLPAREVGGDFYDFIPLSGETWGLAIADVSGKGVPAAIFMALSRTLIRATASGPISPALGLRHANDLILADSRSCMFVTLFYAVLNGVEKTLRYVNAGHNPPLLLKPGEADVVLLRAEGIALGVLENIQLKEAEIRLDPGDVIALYTDGVTEAINAQGEQFGQERLARTVAENRGLAAGEILARLKAAVTAFAGDQPQFDDITLMILKVNET
jgi:sigma-B regulation protein RsbU (phosphoserine phosphatase)